MPVEKAPEPKDILEIGIGKMEGNKEAAIKAYKSMATVLGDALGNVLTLIDGLAVIGGGVSGAKNLFLQHTIDEINSNYTATDGTTLRRLSPQAFNLEDPEQLQKFLKGDSKKISIPGTDKNINYDPLPRVGVGISKLGTSNAVALGAYAFALNTIDRS